MYDSVSVIVPIPITTTKAILMINSGQSITYLNYKMTKEKMLLAPEL